MVLPIWRVRATLNVQQVWRFRFVSELAVVSFRMLADANVVLW